MIDVSEIKEEDSTECQEESKPKTKSSGVRKTGKRGRKPSKIDVKAKLERSRQSARECRARKKLRYQYLEELVASRERAVFQLRSELERFKKWTVEVDNGNTPQELSEYMERDRLRKERNESDTSNNSYIFRQRRRTTTGRTESESSVTSSYIGGPGLSPPSP